ncbi:DNA cytosine methyltransferase [Achromobacter xylosoxidans]|uniref:DNA (cytosine-5-)-methyltransferase n=1 Tax=Alcaligenes xylosoxydans xylosoxydans TaxID=85698 RepID=A0A1R1JUE8_ALCXX|nr:DNA cytosine methyltransferase [Achromobacter xylosoxidans]OMG87979.1 modification methylase [Achromobacter xylosoxidans]
MLTPQYVLGLNRKVVVDIFAGGGGWSTAYEQATGQHVHIAINHNPDALSMHEVNHPQARHYIADVWEVCPRQATDGMPVGWLHLSPDCTDHSQAKGGQPRRKNIRALAWVTVRWAGTVTPDIISLENVVQILKWGRLVAKRCPATGRVVTLDMVPDASGRMVNRVADPGERVPVDRQYLVPDPKHQGKHWHRLVAILRGFGYIVEWRELNAADYGAGTTRTRLFMMARRDGLPITWPDATHNKKPAKGQRGWRPAADGIDWSIEGKTIFGRKKPLADATMRRIARGMKRYVLDSADPFVVPIANWSRDGSHSARQPISTITANPRGGAHAVVAPALVPATHHGADRVYDLREPAKTITAAHRGEFMLSAPVLVQAGYGEREGQAPRALDLQQPLGTVTAGGIKHALASGYLVQAGHGEGKPGARRWSYGCNNSADPVGTLTASNGGFSAATAFMVQANGGYNATPAHDLRRAASTITNSGSQQQLITAHLTTLRRHSTGTDASEPVAGIAARGQHHGLVAAHLTAMSENVVGSDLRDPAPTVLAGAARFGLVQYDLAPEDEAGALQVAAFLMRYYGEGGQWGDLREPASTLTTRDRLALVTVHIQGTPYVIVDIRLRMLTPAELYDLQGFPPEYIITHGHDGRVFTKSQQVHMVGNSVSPPPAVALIQANAPHELLLRKAA